MGKLSNNEKTDFCDIVVSTSIPFKNKLNLDRKVKFGVEIEFENAPKNKVKESLYNKKTLKNWILKDEYTVEFEYKSITYGGELVSPILHNTTNDWKQLKTACNLIKNELGMFRSNSASHIHIDSSILQNNNKYILNFIELWTIYEHIIYRFSYGEIDYPRITLPSYAARISPIFYNILKELRNYENIDIFPDLIHFICRKSLSNTGIRSGVDFSNCINGLEKPKNTIEIRCPNGTINEIIWQNNINFFLKLLIYGTSNNYDKEFMNYKFNHYKEISFLDYKNIYFDDAIELANLIFEDEKDKLYFLKQYLKINDENAKKIKQKIIENNF